MASWILVSRRHEGTLSIEGVVEAVEGGVVRVAIALTHTVMAALWTDTLVTFAHQARGTEAAGDAGAILRTQAVVVECLTALLTLGAETVLVDLSRATLFVWGKRRRWWMQHLSHT